MSKPLSAIIERPVISEKSVTMSQQGRYTFRCPPAANKVEIRRAIEKVYDVKVANINTLIIKGRRKQRRGAPAGRTADWKKAIVSITSDSRPDRLKNIFEGA